MRFRSSGLGEKELKGRFTKIATVGEDLLVCQIKTYEPVEWRMMAGLELKDVRPIFKGLLKPAIFLHCMKTLFYVKKNAREPGDLLCLK
jgi:hypothetical protein